MHLRLREICIPQPPPPWQGCGLGLGKVKCTASTGYLFSRWNASNRGNNKCTDNSFCCVWAICLLGMVFSGESPLTVALRIDTMRTTVRSRQSHSRRASALGVWLEYVEYTAGNVGRHMAFSTVWSVPIRAIRITYPCHDERTRTHTYAPCLPYV